jgi:hypothetical protein
MYSLVFNVFVCVKKAWKFHFFVIGKQVDLLVNPYDVNVFYNNIKVYMFSKQSPSEAWGGAWDHSLAFM